MLLYKGRRGDRLTCPHSLTGLRERDASPLCLAVLAKAASPVPTVAATRSLRDTIRHTQKRQCVMAVNFFNLVLWLKKICYGIQIRFNEKNINVGERQSL